MRLQLIRELFIHQGWRAWSKPADPRQWLPHTTVRSIVQYPITVGFQEGSRSNGQAQDGGQRTAALAIKAAVNFYGEAACTLRATG
jgi:hypothetical protein